MPYFREYEMEWGKSGKGKPTGRIVQSSKRSNYWLDKNSKKFLDYRKISASTAKRLGKQKKKKRKTRKRSSLDLSIDLPFSF